LLLGQLQCSSHDCLTPEITMEHDHDS
jgi:hypothetical protein